MQPLNFRNIRPWNGSQHGGFEELCCQLASCEQVLEADKFYRVGTPDAGVECYWLLKDQTEWGWQAKYVFDVENSQWQQIDESVETALDKHARLVRYTICLPIDRPDARIKGQKSSMDRWNERVSKWKGWAASRGMRVEFDYWGEHEIATRLTRNEHAGRRYFWFQQEEFSQHWFEQHFNEIRARVGPRYTRELHVELPIAEVFEGLGRTDSFSYRLRDLYGQLRRALEELETDLTPEAVMATDRDRESLIQSTMRVLIALAPTSEDPFAPKPWETICEQSHHAIQAAFVCRHRLEQEEELARQQHGDKKEGESWQPQTGPVGTFRILRNRLFQLTKVLDRLVILAQSDMAKVANRPALLLIGNAGIGKTHLFSDVVRVRVEHGLPTVFLLGQDFFRDEPWAQILRRLHLQCSRDEFLGALDAVAQATGRRALIFIDALNDGEGRYLWENHLPSVLAVLHRYPRLGLAVSCRSSYEKVIIRDDLMPDRLIRVEHPGFAEHEFAAARTFLDHFGIERPGVPLLMPEFRHPLFLKILCEGLKRYGLKRMPTGLRGITSIFDLFVDSVNHDLAVPSRLDFLESEHVVHKAVDAVAGIMASTGKRWVPVEEAKRTVDSVLPRPALGYTSSLFFHLVSEGLLAKDDFHQSEVGAWTEGVHFPYERFSDHLICRYLLDRHLDEKHPNASFQPGQVLGSLISDQYAAWANGSLVAALCIQLPERIGKEVFEVAPCSELQAVQEGFTQSLIWRAPAAITDATIEYINRLCRMSQCLDYAVLDAVLTLAAIPGHPLNADFLHCNLRRMAMPDRDVWWSIFLHFQNGEHRAVDRLLDWSWPPDDQNETDHSQIEEEPVRLCCIALTWCLTTPNRFIRDQATKALVNLLRYRPHLLPPVMEAFSGVDDPYVHERLYAVAYGCVMLCEDLDAVRTVAEDTYRRVFADGKPTPHLLLRDYARGIIEYTIHLGCKPEVDLSKVRPPYQSPWPLIAPDLSELETRYRLKDYSGPFEQSYGLVWSSVGDFGDFARYIIGTDGVGGLASWTATPLNASHARGQFDVSLARRWIFQRVVDLGWMPERFGHFDHWVNHNDLREANKPERIGKKYQWIAFHEFAAHVADHLKFAQPWTSARRYDGPWQISRRDIDPSLLARASGPEYELNATAWWAPLSYTFRDSSPQDTDRWPRELADCPAPLKIIEVVRPEDHTHWLTLEGYYRWEEVMPLEDESTEHPRSQFWYQLRSYLVRKKHERKMVEWLNQQHFMGRWMPESFDFTDVFIGEYPWASSFDEYRREWVQQHTRELPFPVIVTGIRYLWEFNTFDCSVDSTVSALLPTPYLVEGMDLAWARKPFRFVNEQRKLIAFDPSAEEAGPSALLISKPDLRVFLKEHDLGIIWVVLGEKNLIGGRIAQSDDWPGQLEIDAVYYLKDSDVVGAPLRAKFVTHTSV